MKRRLAKGRSAMALFARKAGSRGNVTLNRTDRPRDEFEQFARAFHRAAKESAKAVRHGPHGLLGTAAFRAYPIVFLYRHALELYLKAIVWTGLPLLGPEDSKEGKARDEVLNGHLLPPLVNYVERICATMGSNSSWLKDLRRVSSQLHDIDAHSFAFRYPTKTDGRPALATSFSFDVSEFCSVLDVLLPVLEGAVAMTLEEVRIRDEFNAEVARETAE